MAEPISIQQLKDASLDVKSLEEVVNGDENVVVTTRLGETYPSVKGSIKKVFETGGLPATPFETKAQMEIDGAVLADGHYAMVTDDTVNNGLYIKTAGAWVKSNYDPLTQAKSDATAKADVAKTEAISAAALDATAKSDAAKDEAINTAALDATTKADNALLTASNNINSKISFNSSETDLLQASDNLGNIYAKVDKNSELYLANMDGRSVQSAIATTALDATTKADNVLLTAIDDINSKVAFDSTKTDLLQAVDNRGNIYAKVDKNSDLYLANMDGRSVQNALSSVPIYETTQENDLHVFVDEKGEKVAAIDSNSGLQLTELNGSVQDNIRRLSPKITNVRRTKRDWFSLETNEYISMLSASGMSLAPIPLTLMPSRYTVPDTIVNSLKLTPNMTPIPIDSPYYKNDQVVHPFIFECVGTMRGYRYILAINPYTHEEHENPVIYGSNDLINFKMLGGFPQPLDTPPQGGFLSDSGFTYDPERGELICYWRVTTRPAGKIFTSYWCRRTKDLLTWTDKKQILGEIDNAVEGISSPAIIFNPTTAIWHMYNVRQKGILTQRTSTSLYGGWTAPTDLPSGTTVPWHQEVRWVGDKMVMLVNKSDTLNSNYYLAISSNGTDWTFGTEPLFEAGMDGAYKATFMPNFDASGKLYLDVFYTTNHTTDPSLKRRFFHVKTNSITI